MRTSERHVPASASARIRRRGRQVTVVYAGVVQTAPEGQIGQNSAFCSTSDPDPPLYLMRQRHSSGDIATPGHVECGLRRPELTRAHPLAAWRVLRQRDISRRVGTKGLITRPVRRVWCGASPHAVHTPLIGIDHREMTRGRGVVAPSANTPAGQARQSGSARGHTVIEPTLHRDDQRLVTGRAAGVRVSTKGADW